MTLEQMRIKIAEACGWSRVTGSYLDVYKTPTGIGPRGGDIVKLPNYPYDLNACHEMEKVLRKRPLLWQKYVDTLNETLSIDDAIHATAAQRCEAFLKTLELLKL